jgi:hypothetical protein
LSFYPPGGAWFLYHRDRAPAARVPDPVQREEAFDQAVKSGAQLPADWPPTPQALIEAFWQAASEKDYERLTVLCPGSLAGGLPAAL